MSATLIAPEALAARLGDEELRVLDTTVTLDRPPAGGPYTPRSGREAFEREHVPGARFADLIDAFSEPGASLPFTWPSPERLAAAAGALGIGPGVQVVVYAQEEPMWATRLWFLLRAAGFDDVAVLDGGLRAWRDAGLAVEAGAPAPVAPASFHVDPRPALLADLDEVAAAVGAGDRCLINALREEAFRGEGPTSYTRPGRIPASVNVPHPALLDPGTGRFRPPDELRDLMAAAGALGDAPVIAYCGGGISATMDLFALALVGRDDGRLYDGSLSEWSARPQLPLERG